jgi:excisionase family DNA binding protein
MSTPELCPLPNMLRVRDIAGYLDICTRVAYQLVKTPGFPLVKVTPKSYRIPREAFLEWLEADPPVRKLNEARAQQQGLQS